jgi:hypothetical protein
MALAVMFLFLFASFTTKTREISNRDKAEACVKTGLKTLEKKANKLKFLPVK